MKILLLHPDDSLELGTWSAARWDMAVDLGWSGRNTYSRQAGRFGFPVSSIYDLLDHHEHRCKMRELLALGLGQVVDSDSIDWWEVFSAYPYAQLEQLMLLSKLAEQIPAEAEVFATTSHFAVRALSLLLNREIKSFSPETKNGFEARARRYWKAALAFRPAQLAEIAFDKWDTDYRFRRHFTRALRVSSTPAILLPSAYANVTRAQVAYARMLPHRRFLLVLTRRHGRIADLPANVEARSLAAYAPRTSPAIGNEQVHLLERWQNLQNDVFETDPVLSLARKLGVFDGFADFLKSGLGVRDAWREVFAQEPIAGVLSADENNPYTRLPILLARSRKLRTVFSDHGALNMSFAIRRPLSETFLARGDMARDYFVSWCGIPAERVVVGAARDAGTPSAVSNRIENRERDWIVYYSEAYELLAGRTQDFYRELLPELCRLASRVNRKVVVKLHPFENFRRRKALVARVLDPAQLRLVELREGPMTPDLFARAWCSLTVESSVAAESTLNGVPCFLCSWFDAAWYEYGKQYAKFSAGYPLDSPQRIREIPELLEKFRVTEAARHGLQATISPERLEAVLCGT